MTPTSSAFNRHAANSCWVRGCGKTQVNHGASLLSKTQRLPDCIEEPKVELLNSYALRGMDLISTNAEEEKKKKPVVIKGYLEGDWIINSIIQATDLICSSEACP